MNSSSSSTPRPDPAGTLRNGWLSAYLPFEGDLYGPASDRAVLDIVAPVIARLEKRGFIRQHFFIRYYEEGPHLRLRLRVEHTAPLTTVAAAVENAADLPVRFIPYERETVRYGGAHAMPIAEALFEASSLASVVLIRESDGERRTARLGKAALALVTQVRAFTSDPELAAHVLTQYYDYALDQALDPDERVHAENAFRAQLSAQGAQLGVYVAETWRRLDRGEQVTDSLDQLFGAFADGADVLRTLLARGKVVREHGPLTTWESVLATVLTSQIHMTFNRLGVAPVEEAYLCFLVASTLDP